MKFMVIISAGVGPIEVGEFVARLGVRFEHWLAPWVVCKQVQGDDRAPRSICLTVDNADLRAVSSMVGTHALVCRSPSRGKAGRKRWFASVGVLENGDNLPAGDLQPADLRMQACRAQGPGGQNVNKRNTAVRLVHGPTGLGVRVSDQRTQGANRRIARNRLARMIQGGQARRRQDRQKTMRVTHYQLVRGQPVCVYRIDSRGQLCLVSGHDFPTLGGVQIAPSA